MVKLSVNLNKVALLRNQRDIGYPSVVSAARAVIEAGAKGITVHPRPDQRHIRRSDVYELKEFLTEHYGTRIEYNIEGYPDEDWLALVRENRPTQATLVPDSPDQKTSDHGWDLPAQADQLRPIIASLKAIGCRVALFMDADADKMALARALGADRVELYTGPYGELYGTPEGDAELGRLMSAAQAAHEAGLGLNAGHDLNLENLPALRRAAPHLLEVSIGHAITADALHMGFKAAVKAYLSALSLEDAGQQEVA